MSSPGEMRRRTSIALLSGAVLPLAVAAQTPQRTPRVGFVGATSPTANKHNLDALRQGLRALGYVEGQTIELEVRWAEGRYERIPELMTELVRLKVDVLLAGNSLVALAAKTATRTIPIVLIVTDPVGFGLVASLSHPGGNVTGLSLFNEELSSKRLQLLMEFVPLLARVAVLRNPLTKAHPCSGKIPRRQPTSWAWRSNLSRCAGLTTSRRHSQLQNEATLRPSSPWMMRSPSRTGRGSWPWLPAAASRPCTVFANSLTTGA